jgi:hypothetical protein
VDASPICKVLVATLGSEQLLNVSLDWLPLLHKRRLGSALTARNDAAQHRELVPRALTHNVMLSAAAT